MKTDLRADCEAAYHEVTGPASDEIDEAISTIRRARKILADDRLMEAVRERVEESRKAVAQASTEMEGRE